MKLPAILTILLLAGQLGQAQIENDKVLHFAGGGLFGLAGAGLGKELLGDSPAGTIGGALILSTAVGAGKEALDASRENGQWDNADLLATSLGGLAAGLLVELFTRRKPKGEYTGIRPTRRFRTASQSLPGVIGSRRDQVSFPRYLENISHIGL